MLAILLFSALTELLANPPILVFLSALLATFIGSVMADEQSDRLRNGTFGAIAGSSVGGLAALLTKNQDLLLIGVFGSATGAIAGWLAYLALSVIASNKTGRRVLEYHVSGLKGVREQLKIDERNLLLAALSVWSANFSRMIAREREFILRGAIAERNYWIQIIVASWLTGITDVFNLVFDALAEKPEYRSRVTIIVFGRRLGVVEGRHWISYAGRLPLHRKKPFPGHSIAFQVLCGKKESPFFERVSDANKEGQNRDKDSNKGQGQLVDSDEEKKQDGGLDDTTPKSRERSYKSFISFRVCENAVLSLDWPSQLKEDDPYVSVARDLFYLEIIPAISDLIQLWSGNLEAEVELDPLAQSQAQAAIDKAANSPAS